MNCVFIVPTGIGAEIGGHAGDATPAAKLIASVCDKLFIHPNVVNASDINEMTDNMLYVEGSLLDRFLEGTIGLKEVYSNEILVAVNEITPNIVNSVSAARATMGADITLIKLRLPLKMITNIKIDKSSTGRVYNTSSLIEQIRNYNFDVLVIHTPIDTDAGEAKAYLSMIGGVNPWGGVEAYLSKMLSKEFDKPVIHAPVENSEIFKTFNEIVDPRKAAETVSVSYLHCCLKGAHKAPKPCRLGQAYCHLNTDIDFMISPVGVWGPPHIACYENNIPIIFVNENKTVMNENHTADDIVVANYLEATGIIAAKKAGVMIESVRRPLLKTKIL